MRKVILLSFIIIGSTKLFAQKDQRQIEATVVGFFNGLSLVNADTLRQYSTIDFHLLEDGQVWNLDTLINKIMPRKILASNELTHLSFLRQNRLGKWHG